MRYLVLVTTLLLLVVACETKKTVHNVYSVPFKGDHPEAYSCVQDSDCIMQATSCNSGRCPVVVNKKYSGVLNCENTEEIKEFLNHYCPPRKAVCKDKVCISVERPYPEECSNDTECVLVQIPCGKCARPIAVNIDYQSELACPTPKILQHCDLDYSNLQPACANKICMVVNSTRP